MKNLLLSFVLMLFFNFSSIRIPEKRLENRGEPEPEQELTFLGIEGMNIVLSNEDGEHIYLASNSSEGKLILDLFGIEMPTAASRTTSYRYTDPASNTRSYGQGCYC